MTDANSDLLEGYAYHLFFDGVAGGGFAECSGLDAGVKGPEVTLHSGVIVTREFFDWVMEHKGPHALRLAQVGEDGLERRSWALVGARLVRVTATTFTGRGFPFRMETLELKVEAVIGG